MSSLFMWHGMLQVLAFGILFPAGMAVAFLRHRIGPAWLRWHVALQVSGTTAVAIAIALAILGRHPHKSHEGSLSNKHKTLGRIIVLLLALQFAWAYLGRRYAPWSMWLAMHAFLGVSIVVAGWGNIYLAHRMRH
jgi:hypothetical protein